ncbi:MAG: hypothetical protein DCC67_16830 [Planctomycetota bacterium]|nr:MAG: hypothetical protein DCC67_16830 [Planctomycetota bacterium]
MNAAFASHKPLWLSGREARDLAKGLWPQSAIMWLIFGWFALYIIRPWEVLAPWMAALRVERVYCTTVLGVLVISGKLRFDFSKQTLSLAALIAVMYITAFTGMSYSRSSLNIYSTLVHVAMYVAMLSVIRRPRDLLCIAWMYLVIMAMYLGKSEYEYFIHGRHDFTQGVPRLLGIDLTYRHYNSVAASALLTMPVLQLLWTTRSDISASWSARSRTRLKWALLAYGCLAVSAVLLTNSRGGMLGLAVYFFLACVTGKTAMRAVKTLLLAGLIVGPVVLFGMPETQMRRLSTLWNANPRSSAQGSLEGRKQAVIDGLRMFAENPMTGVGLGCFKRYRVLRGDSSDIEAHNIYIEVLGEMGALGGLAFGTFVACTWFNFRKIGLLAASAGTAEGEFLRKLALAGRNSLLLLLYFGCLGSNLDRFNWFWLAGVGVAGVGIARRCVSEAAENEEAMLADDDYSPEPSEAELVH